ncbi:hypothetical protein D1872_276200 [compost metagenome]
MAFFNEGTNSLTLAIASSLENLTFSDSALIESSPAYKATSFAVELLQVASVATLTEFAVASPCGSINDNAVTVKSVHFFVFNPFHPSLCIIPLFYSILYVFTIYINRTYICSAQKSSVLLGLSFHL